MNIPPPADRCRIPALGSVALMGALGMVFVLMYGRNLPYADDYVLLPVVANVDPFTWGWLWEQQNEHRFPIGKVVFLMLARTTAMDVRAGMFLNVLLLTFAGWLCVSSMARARGRYSCWDTLYPLILLQWGHWFNLLMCIQMYVVIAVLATIGAFCFVLRRGWDTWPGIAGLAACEITLSLCGGTGLPVATAFAVFAATAAVVLSRENGRGDWGRGAALLAIAILVAISMSLYFAGWERPDFHPQPEWSLATLFGVLQFLADAGGPDAVFYWEISAGVMVALVLCSLALLASGRGSTTPDKLQRLGLATGIASMVGLATAVGYSRAGMSASSVLEPRYVTQAMPLLVILMMVFHLYGNGTWLRWGTGGLSLYVIVLMLTNMVHGQMEGVKRARQLDVVLADLRSGQSVPSIAFRHYRKFYPFTEKVAARYLWILCTSRLGPYADPKFGCDCGEVPYLKNAMRN